LSNVAIAPFATAVRPVVRLKGSVPNSFPVRS
jgi:hypothetical protein